MKQSTVHRVPILWYRVYAVKEMLNVHIDGLVQDCSNSSALAMELLQSCTKPSISYGNGRDFQWHFSLTAQLICDISHTNFLCQAILNISFIIFYHLCIFKLRICIQSLALPMSKFSSLIVGLLKFKKCKIKQIELGTYNVLISTWYFFFK